jgi:N-methylhydantoinase A
MGIQELLIPQAPGVFSAWGMLMADTVYDFSQTEISLLENTTLDTTETAFDGLESEASETLSKSDYDGAEQQFERSIEMRYHGQEHTVRVPFDDVESISDLKLAFAEKHKSRFGHAMDDPAEIVHFRVRAIGLNDKPTLQPRETAGGDPLIGSRDAYCFAADDRVDFDIYDREKIETGAVISGPAIILEPTTTVVFYSDQEATVDEYGHLVISGGEGE